MLQAYRQHVAERAALGIPPLPLSAAQTAELIELIKAPPAGEEAFLLDLLTHRVPPGDLRAVAHLTRLLSDGVGAVRFAAAMPSTRFCTCFFSMSVWISV